MKRMRSIVVVALVAAFVFCTCIPVQALTADSYRLITGEAVEYVVIEGTKYKFEYNYGSDIREVVVTNCETNQIDIVTFDVNNCVLCLNGQIASVNISPPVISPMADAQLISADSMYIEWGTGATAAVVAAAISAGLGFLGGSYVIAAMGTAALGTLAGSCVGGTLYVELYLYTAPLALPQNVIRWTFTASTGDSYGPFITYL